MHLSIQTWVSETDQPTAATLFGVLEAGSASQLPIPSSNGHWENARTIDQRDFKEARKAIAAIAVHGHYLFTSGNSRDGMSDDGAYPTSERSAEDVVSAPDLSKAEKAEILAQREEDALSLQRAADEGMIGGEGSKFDEVKRAQNRLTAKGRH